MSNSVAWLDAKGSSLVVNSGPMHELGKDEVLIRNGAVAFNPADVAMQNMGIFIEKYPTALGCDAAGTIVAVGSAVTTFKVGDRVLASLQGAWTKQTKHFAFQLYCVVEAKMAAKFPESITLAQASVLPLAILTAATGLYTTDMLDLPLPSLEAPKQNKVVIIWGGSSSVGATAIQLAINSGFAVATTASPQNHEFVKALGAQYVFNHTSETVVDDVVTALQGKELAGVYNAIYDLPTLKKCATIADRLGGKKMVVTVDPMPAQEGWPAGVKVVGIAAHPIFDTPKKIGETLFGDWLYQALSNGSMKAKPDPQVVGKGLEHVQLGLDTLKKGVSASKIVVEL